MLDSMYPQFTSIPSENIKYRTDLSDTVTPNSEHEDKVSETRQVRTMPGQEEVGPDGQKRDSLELTQEAEEIRKLQARDREVRAHEAAHAAAGGAYAGAASFTYERGPDGTSYAVGGEVSIDVSAIPGDPEATLQKAVQVRSAALAPAEPSAQDMKVAQRAQAMAAEARGELASQQNKELDSVSENLSMDDDTKVSDEGPAPIAKEEPVEPVSQISSIAGGMSGIARLSVYA